MINIAYDTKKVSDEKAQQLATNLQRITMEAIGGKDVFVYIDAKPMTFAVDPIEVFIQVNQHTLLDPAAFLETIAQNLTVWKQQSSFETPVNLNVIPVTWHYKIGL